MRNLMAICLILGAVMLPSNVGAQNKNKHSVSKTELQQSYSSYLVEEGYKPNINEDGDVRFKREGRTYFIAIDEKDPEFFRVVLPNIWKIETETERSQILAAGDASNAKAKVSKVFTQKDNV